MDITVHQVEVVEAVVELEMAMLTAAPVAMESS
jgi:hypothetical protein